jgi:hypothetical protein
MTGGNSEVYLAPALSPFAEDVSVVGVGVVGVVVVVGLRAGVV